MNQEANKATITIVGVETKMTSNGKTMFKIKGNDNRSYQVWQTIRDGSDSVAYKSLSAHPNMGVGKTFDIYYKEEIGEYKGKQVTYRTINQLFPSTAQAGTSQKVAQVGMSEAKQAVDDEKWDRINFGKCKYGFLIEAYKKGVDVDMAEKEAELWAQASMRIKWLNQPAPVQPPFKQPVDQRKDYIQDLVDSGAWQEIDPKDVPF